MFCKFCGKEIEKNSNFCRLCGNNLGKSNFNINTILGENVTWMKYLILLYILWFLIGVCYVLCNIPDDFDDFYSEVVYQTVLYTIVIPYAIFCAIYIFLKIRKKQLFKLYSLNNTSSPIIENVHFYENEKEEKCKLKEIKTLLEFSNENGQMQIIKKDGMKEYCTFTNGSKIIVVGFSNRLGVLSGIEISNQKFSLCIKCFENGGYELDSLNNLTDTETLLLNQR